MLKASGNRYFDIAEVLSFTDIDFCKRFGYDIKELNEKKKAKDESDKLWVYVPAI